MPLEHDGRPVSERATARIVVLDQDNRALLINERDPNAPHHPTYWLTPGGGIDDGEAPRQAAARELAEELGLTVAPEALRGPIAIRTVVHAWSHAVLVQPETFFVIQVDGFDPTPVALTEQEKDQIVGHRWWTIEDLRRTDEMVWPVGLVNLVIARDTPAAWPVSLSTEQESTVPATLSDQR
jgi:8-oxo-dGTP pyrophosphatase MutT (NUDIX family)